MFRIATTTVFLWCCAVSQALAFASPGGAGKGFGGGGGGGGGGGSSAPEIDGPAGMAAIAVLVSAGLIAYNRYKKK
jgi:hypothetical protein